MCSLLQTGFYVDKDHLAEQQIAAEAELRNAEHRFRQWVARYVGEHAATHMNVNSATQIQTLLFGGFTSGKAVVKKPTAQQLRDGVTDSTSEKPSVPKVCPSVIVFEKLN